MVAALLGIEAILAARLAPHGFAVAIVAVVVIIDVLLVGLAVLLASLEIMFGPKGFGGG